MRLWFCLAILAWGRIASLPASSPSGDDTPIPTEQNNRLLHWLEGNFNEQVSKSKARFGVFVYEQEKWLSVGQVKCDRAVLLIHGLDDVGTIWDELAPALQKHKALVLKFEYPNDQSPRDSASLLLKALSDLRQKGIVHIDLVAHSMGGLVARDALTRKAYVENDSSLPRIGHLIMVGTPNHGSVFARMRIVGEAREQLVHLCKGEAHIPDALIDGAGQAGPDLIPDSPYLCELNSRPMPVGFPITIIAGRMEKKGSERLARLINRKQREGSELTTYLEAMHQCWEKASNSLGDGVVTLDSTKLEGVSDFHVVHGNHRSILNGYFSKNTSAPAIPIILETLFSCPE